jgi:hypothetical protein
VDAKLEGGNKEERGLKEGDRGGHGPKIGRSVMGKEEEKEQKIRTLFLRYKKDINSNMAKISILETNEP